MSTAASDVLRADHRLIEVQIERLSSAIKLRATNMITEVQEALSEIKRVAEPHFRKEENALYAHFHSQYLQLLAELNEQHEHARESNNALLRC